MSPLKTCIHALIGHGVMFYRDNGHSLQINGDEDFLQSVDLEPIRYEKSLCVLLMPFRKSVTARDFYDALEDYDERVAIMMFDGGLDKGQAEIQALAPVREWLASLP